MMPLMLRHLLFLLLWLPFTSWGQFQVFGFLIKPVLSAIPASRVEHSITLNDGRTVVDTSMFFDHHSEPGVVLSKH